jgi:hypothetical protein
VSDGQYFGLCAEIVLAWVMISGTMHYCTNKIIRALRKPDQPEVNGHG